MAGSFLQGMKSPIWELTHHTTAMQTALATRDYRRAVEHLKCGLPLYETQQASASGQAFARIAKDLIQIVNELKSDLDNAVAEPYAESLAAV